MGGVTKRDDTYIGALRGHSRDVERFCNAFAADVLVPRQDLEKEDQTVSDDNIARLARIYRVSREVVLRRFLEMGVVSERYYRDRMHAWASDYFEKSEDDSETGGNYYATQASYLSDTFARLAFRSYYQGTISIEDLARHLNLKMSSVNGLEQALLQKAG
jgi:Zn-dependent peptidase ImmA (M78 family)